jgi:hypothetical protein
VVNLHEYTRVLLVNRLHAITSVILACLILGPVASHAQEPFDCAVGIEAAEDILQRFKPLKLVSMGD